MNQRELEQLPIDELDRMAFGVVQGVQRLPLDQISIRYRDDYLNALDYVEMWPDDYEEALESEPVEVALERGVYWLEDGHHRYVTAQARGDRDILADLTIKDNPVVCLMERQANVPELLYHVTPKRNLPRIERLGLVPLAPADMQDELGVYLFTDYTAMEDALMNWLGDRFEESEDLVVLTVSPEGLDLHPTGAGYELVSRDVIPPENILQVTTERTASRGRDAGPQELELERLFQALLPGTKFANRVFAVGGYVRDQLQEKEPADLDVAVELPYGAQRLVGFLADTFGGAISEPEPLTYDYPIWYIRFTEDVEFGGEHYGVGGAELDLTDTQTVERLGDEPTTVFGPVQRDVERRDFTVNMLYKDLTSGAIMDPTGVGQQDIEHGLLRVRPDQDAARGFREQPRRMLRLIRFMCQYDWEPESEVEVALVESADQLEQLSRHDLEKEFEKLQRRGVLEEAVSLMQQYGMLRPLQRAWRRERNAAYDRQYESGPLTHRRHTRDIPHEYALLFSDDPDRNRHYGDHVWTLQTELPEVHEDLIRFAADYFEVTLDDAEELVDPPNIVDDAGAWEDQQFNYEVWERFGEPGYRTYDGAVVLDRGAVELEYSYDGGIWVGEIDLPEDYWEEWKARVVKYDDNTSHWWLTNPKTGEILDPTAEQFTQYGEEPPYDEGRPAGPQGIRYPIIDGVKQRKPSNAAMQVLTRIKHPAAEAIVSRFAPTREAITAALSDDDVRLMARQTLGDILGSLVEGEKPGSPWRLSERKGIPYFYQDAKQWFGLPSEVHLVGYSYMTKFVDWFGNAGAAFQHDLDGKEVLVWPVLDPDGAVQKISSSAQQELFHELVHAFDDLDPDEQFHGVQSYHYYNSPREFKAYFLMGAEEIEKELQKRMPKLDVYLDSDMTFEESWWWFVKSTLGWDTEEKFLDRAYRFFPGMWVFDLSPENKQLLEESLLELREHLLAEYQGKARQQFPKERAASLQYHGRQYTAALETVYEGEGREQDNQHLTARQEGTLPLIVAVQLRGRKGERRDWHKQDGERWFGNYPEDRWRDFVDDVRRNGIREPIFIVVEWEQGKPVAYVYEGNHRIKAAVQAGLDEVPVEVRFFGHAEQYYEWPTRPNIYARIAQVETKQQLLKLRRHQTPATVDSGHGSAGAVSDARARRC